MSIVEKRNQEMQQMHHPCTAERRPMLELRDVSFRYKGRHSDTLRHVGLSLESGEMLLLAGRSGCGKSTLIKVISGLVSGEGQERREGTVLWNGEDMADWPPEKIGLLAGTVYQTPDDQLFAMTVEDEAGFALENQGEAPEAVHDQVEEILGLTGLAGLEKRGIHQLSGGQRQRMALASVLIGKPRLLILDEPVSQMDPRGVQDFMELLLRLNREEGIAILMIEHRVNELACYFHRLAIMREGRIVYDGPLQAAWAFLTGRENLGLREPQCVKLGRVLGLPELSSDVAQTVLQIKTYCRPVPAAEAERSGGAGKHQSSSRPGGKTGETGRNGRPLVEAEKVCFRYPGTTEDVLKEVSFSLNAGEIIALMGCNGAGKSTLLNLLGGLTGPSAGRLLFEGGPLARQRGSTGYLLQEPDLMLLAGTVWEELKWKNDTLTDAEAEALLQRLHLEPCRDDFPLALSKGQRLRTVLGSFFAWRPKLLLLDEPTTGQDEASLQEIAALLSHYRDHGGTVLLCTHDVELASCLADHVLLLNQGRVLAYGTVFDVLSRRDLLAAGGLVAPPVLAVSGALGIPPCITVEEVCHCVGPATLGRN